MATSNQELDSSALFEIQLNTSSIRRPSLPKCPHCHHEFGSASLSIHIERCRDKEKVSEQPEKQQELKPRRKRKIPSLQDLCVRFITSHLDVHYFEKQFSQPAYQADLLASLPSNITQSIILALLNQIKQLRKQPVDIDSLFKSRQRRTQVRQLEVQLDKSKQEYQALSRRILVNQQKAQRLLDEQKTLKAENRRFLSELNHATEQIRKFKVSTEKYKVEIKNLKSLLNAQPDSKPIASGSLKAPTPIRRSLHSTPTKTPPPAPQNLKKTK